MRLFTFIAGAVAGYVFGTRQGRESYESMKSKAKQMWEDPQTQQKIHELGEKVKDKAPEVSAAVSSAASKVTEQVKNKVGSQSSESKDIPVEDDVISDPAKDDQIGSDWASEGGTPRPVQ
ncbi:gas vesicle protein [Neomicrococcus aestuarii]|uniref:Gas vesicle protein n=1 Tax=Neomicrococcus aestuarii TaxID=556325 RepID=A0A7W8TR95_9MICC|nr:YtxH domain-containing protein [Neomicrococcus aestuarii]MBB5511452.1 gas vesicle protein [Neomicrococcus aestuarii]